jgi:hypothetical protein
MADDPLGTLVPDEHVGGMLTGSVDYLGQTVELRIELDGEEMARCLEHARHLVTGLAAIDSKARQVAASQLLETYNNDWRHYETADGEGGFTAVAEQKLTAAQFMSRLKLASLVTTGTEIGQLEYDCGALFRGHSVFVTAFDGDAFSDLRAELFD